MGEVLAAGTGYVLAFGMIVTVLVILAVRDKRAASGYCLECGHEYRLNDGYGDSRLFCKESCSHSFMASMGL